MHLLTHGISMHQGRLDGHIQLERTGPSIAPITFPGAGDVVITEKFRSALESSGLNGFSFLPVIKYHIVDLDLARQDATAEEPEDYILSGEHSEQASDALGNLWELITIDGVDVERGENLSIRLLAETWNGADFFTARTTRIKCVSERAKTWLKRHIPEYVAFQPAD